MFDHRGALLIVGHWCRPLAQSAWRAGMRAVVLDLFADADTQRYALRAQRIADPSGTRIDFSRAARAAQQLAADCDALVYAAGFEQTPEQIELIAAGRRILGNTPATVRAVKQPIGLARLLTERGIAHPQTQLQAPTPIDGWLRKRVGEQGGAHVVPLTPGYTAQAHDYFQRKLDGTPHSATFLADGRQARIIGFNQQLPVALGSAPYCYGGAISHVALPPTVMADIAEKLHALVAATGVVGLNGIDFMVRGREYWLLEVNPRPPATLDLYDEDCPGGLLAWHLAACAGELVATPLRARHPRGHAIVYAPHASRVPRGFEWPAWCSDVEPPGAEIGAGAPVCTVNAQGDTPAPVQAMLSQRRQAILRAIALN